MKSFLLLCTAALFIVACGQADHSVDPDEISAIDDAAEMQESVNAYQASGLSSDGTGGSSFYGDWRDGAIAVSSRDGWGTPWNIQRWMSGYGLHYRNNPFNIIARYGPLGRSEHVLRQRAYLFEEENGVRYAIIPHGTKRYLVYPSGLEYRAGVQYLAMVEIPYRVLDDTKLKKLMTFGWETDLAVPADIEDSFIYNGEVYTVTQNGNIYKIKKFNPQGPSEDKYVGLELDESAGVVQLTLYRDAYNSRSVVFADDEIIGRFNPVDVMLEVFENTRREISADWNVSDNGTQMEKEGLTSAEIAKEGTLFGPIRNPTSTFVFASAPDVELTIIGGSQAYVSGAYNLTLNSGWGINLGHAGQTEDIIITYQLPLAPAPESVPEPAIICTESINIWQGDTRLGITSFFRYYDEEDEANLIASKINSVRILRSSPDLSRIHFGAEAEVFYDNAADIYEVRILLRPHIYEYDGTYELHVGVLCGSDTYLEVDEEGIKSILTQGLYASAVYRAYQGKFIFNGVKYAQTDGSIHKVAANGIYDPAGPRIELYNYSSYRTPLAGGLFYSPGFIIPYVVQYDETHGWYKQFTYYAAEYLTLNDGDLTELFNDTFN
ncbi:hypothetical protein [Pelagibaculum spongiae]|uniref:Uncharacterized protein n=1 Tax=Pelagibaculum spongiae TaxID=2080658 RepID=A0A2V1GYP7_9GAMM|nr:hypothetical protein [Pelagibaculum spongiae]PVZ71559.1 hypothetical protein DC094_00510 [Pelagibaculum spongiae]